MPQIPLIQYLLLYTLVFATCIHHPDGQLGVLATDTGLHVGVSSIDPCFYVTPNCLSLDTPLYRSCYGAPLDYDHTSHLYVGENKTLQNIQDEMSKWERLRMIPKCWEAIRPLLCSVYRPKCTMTTRGQTPQSNATIHSLGISNSENVLESPENELSRSQPQAHNSSADPSAPTPHRHRLHTHMGPPAAPQANLELVRPRLDRCESVLEPCRLITEMRAWPEFMYCDNAHYVAHCYMPLRNYKFPATGQEQPSSNQQLPGTHRGHQPGGPTTSSTNGNDATRHYPASNHEAATVACMAPLVPTTEADMWYTWVDGCGIQCYDPYYTHIQHTQTHYIVLVCASVCLALNFFTLLTFMLDVRRSSRYPSRVMMYMNACYMVSCCAWLVQFIPDARDDIVCRRDGTRRVNEPNVGWRSVDDASVSTGQSVSCTVIFVLLYFPLVAAAVWFAILAFCWHFIFKQHSGSSGMSSRLTGSAGRRGRRDGLRAKNGTFHLIAWCVPLVLTIMCMAITQISGYSLAGVCFISDTDSIKVALLLLLPVGLPVTVGVVLLVSCIVKLYKLQKQHNGESYLQYRYNIRVTLAKYCIFTTLVIVWVTLSILIHVYTALHREEWQESFKHYISCLAGITPPLHSSSSTPSSAPSSSPSSACSLVSKPNLLIMQAHIFCFFGGGFTVSFWVWNRSTWTLWKDHISKCMSSSNTDGSEDDSALLHKEKLHDNSRRGMSAYSRHNKHRHNRHSQRRHYRYATDTALGSRQHSYKSIQQEAGVADSSECFEFDSVTSCDVSSGWFSGLQKPAHATTTHLLHPTHPHQHTTQAHSSSGSVVAPTQRLSHQHPTTSNRSRRFSDSELGSMTWSHFASLESCEQQYYGHLSQLDQQSHRRLNYRHNNRYAGSHGSQQSSVGRFDYVSDRGSVSGTELDNSFMQAVPLRGKRRHYTNNDAPQMDPSALLLSTPTGGEDPPYYTHNTHYAQPALAPSAINMKDIQGMAFGQSTRRNSSISSAQSLAVPSIQMSWDLPSLDAPLNSAGGARGSAGVPLVMLRNEDLDRRSVESRIPPADESTDETLLQDKTKQISTEDNRNIPEACAAMLPHVTSNGGNSNADDAVPPSPKLAFIRVREPDSTHSLLDPGSTHSLLGISSGTVMTHPSGPSSGCVSGDDELDDLQLHDLESLSSSDDVDSSRLSDGSHRPNGSNARPALVQDKTPGPPVFQQKKIIPVTQSNRSSLATDMPYLLPGQVEDVNNAKYKRPSETVTEIDCNNVLDSS